MAEIQSMDLLIGYKLLEHSPKGTTDEMADYIVEKIMEAYNEAIPLV